tara:strand:+ start:505 stop:855 length:351 start_codon:yes stop_codon:yes gene_type:complete
MSAAIATGGLLAITVLSKVLHEPQVSHELGHELLNRALEWKHYADEDATPLMKLQHAIYANAYLHAARTAVRDSELEHMTGLDLRKLKRSSDQSVQDAIQSITQSCPKFKGKIVRL